MLFGLIAILFITSCTKKNSLIESPLVDRFENVETVDLPAPCNGYPSLCDRKFNEVTFATSHNAFSYRGGFNILAANHEEDITAQLKYGIRGLSIDVYETSSFLCSGDGLHVYHGNEIFGCQEFSKVLGEIKDFMDDNPREVIAILLEGNATISDIADEFDAAGLSESLHQQAFADPWPTLEEMIESGKRLFVLSDQSNAGSEPGFHYMWNYAVDTDYQAESRADFDCDYDRGNPDGPLFLMNHFITILSPQLDSAAAINSYSYLFSRASDCSNSHGRPINFIMVDFYNRGDVLEVVKMLNSGR